VGRGETVSISGKDKSLAAAKRVSIKTNPVPAAKKKRRRIKESIENKRERKAWRTLAIITGRRVDVGELT
jgi:hypothetical protein